MLPSTVEQAMPRYFFHRMDGYVDRDEIGTDLSDLVEARIQAVVFAAETLRDRPGDLWPGEDLRVEVTDEGGNLLFTLVVQAIDAPAASELLKPGGT